MMDNLDIGSSASGPTQPMHVPMLVLEGDFDNFDDYVYGYSSPWETGYIIDSETSEEVNPKVPINDVTLEVQMLDAIIPSATGEAHQLE